MKMFISSKLSLALAVIGIATLNAGAAQTEHSITFALTGVYQNVNAFGDYIASPFRVTTKDVLVEISLARTNDFTYGSLHLIESLDDTNVLSRIVVRKGANESDVTEFFDVEHGEENILTERIAKGALKSATFHAIDRIDFSTLETIDDGRSFILQAFTKESLVVFNKTLSGTNYTGFARNLSADVIGEVRDIIGLIGPVKGKIKIGPPKFVP